MQINNDKDLIQLQLQVRSVEVSEKSPILICPVWKKVNLVPIMSRAFSFDNNETTHYSHFMLEVVAITSAVSHELYFWE